MPHLKKTSKLFALGKHNTPQAKSFFLAHPKGHSHKSKIPKRYDEAEPCSRFLPLFLPGKATTACSQPQLAAVRASCDEGLQ